MLAGFLLLTAACSRPYDYAKHLSEIKRDVFLAETEGFSLTLSCIEREHPYASDGVTCPMTKLVEIAVTADGGSALTVSVDGGFGGEMSYRSVENDWFYSESVKTFPEEKVSVSVTKDGITTEILATSIKNEDTMSAEEALDVVVKQEAELLSSLMKNGAFSGEFRVRLLRREVNYYYVGVIYGNGKTLSLLLGAESGKVLARRESDA